MPEAAREMGPIEPVRLALAAEASWPMPCRDVWTWDMADMVPVTKPIHASHA